MALDQPERNPRLIHRTGLYEHPSQESATN